MAGLFLSESVWPEVPDEALNIHTYTYIDLGRLYTPYIHTYTYIYMHIHPYTYYTYIYI